LATIRRSSFRGKIETAFADFIVMSSAVRSRKPIPTETSCAWEKTSTSGFLYGDVPDESETFRTARSVWLEIKSDNVEEMTQKILDFGVRKLEVPDPHLYFQAPGGQCLRLVGADEDLSFYAGLEQARTWQRSDPSHHHVTRGEAQALVTVTLGAKEDEQRTLKRRSEANN